jgi:hypothetical protein
LQSLITGKVKSRTSRTVFALREKRQRAGLKRPKTTGISILVGLISGNRTRWKPEVRGLYGSRFACFAQLLNDLHLKFVKALTLCIPFVAELFENGFMLREGGWFHMSSG